MQITVSKLGTALLGEDLEQVSELSLAAGSACVFTSRCPDKPTPNEDSCLLMPCGNGKGILAVADGFGGQPAGDQASRLAIEALQASIETAIEAGQELRDGILNGFEQANAQVMALGVGACTTLTVAEINAGSVRPYHVGDSELIVVGQQGKLKLQTVSHSPVAYGVEAGLIKHDEALHHEDRHIVSNMLGTAEMRIEIGAVLELRPRDTVVLGSDGLFDNLLLDEIVELTRKGPLAVAGASLHGQCESRMRAPVQGLPSKPDDLTFILFRLHP